MRGSLPPDMRTRIDESRGWDSEADRRTAHEEGDCARIAYAAASSIACRLRKREGAVSVETEQGAVDPKPKIWHRLKVSQVPRWVNVALNAAKFWENKDGVG